MKNELLNLMELLLRYKEQLPLELQDKLKQLAEDGISDVDSDSFHSMYPSVEKFKTSFKTDKILRYSTVLKKVVYFDDDLNEFTEYPKNFWVKVNDVVVVEW